MDLASGEKLPQDVIDAIFDDNIIKAAWNAQFERTCLSKYFGTQLSPDSWRCSMVHSASLSLPLKLEIAAKVLKVSEQKDKEGERLIKYYSVPCKPTKKNGGRTRNLPQHEEKPGDWQKFKDYCLQDVRTERAIRKTIERFPMLEHEWDYYHMDQRINDRGILIDMELVEQAIKCDLIQTEIMLQRAYELTGLENPNSVTQLKSWLEGRGLHVESLAKKDVVALIADIDKNSADQEALDMLTLRLQMSKSSIKKYQAAERCTCKDGRARGLFQFSGANRTQRWAGRFIQLQNLVRNEIHTLDEARELIKMGCFDMVASIYGKVPEILSQLIRTMLIPKPGYEFIVVDFSAIEARVLAWLAGEKWVLDAFRNNEDIYCSTASQMYGVPVIKHGVNGELRQKGKIATLACGYQGSVSALKAMDSENTLNEDELPQLIKDWRNANPNIVRFWWDLEGAAIKTVKDHQERTVGRITVQFYANTIWLVLPSGRKLAYISPKLEPNRFGRMSMTFLGPADESNGAKRTSKGASKKASKKSSKTSEKIEEKTEKADKDSDKNDKNPEDADKNAEKTEDAAKESKTTNTKKFGRNETYGGKLAENCIAEGTLVMTSRGLIPIENVKLSDQVWDGVEWVHHDGIIYKGIQETVAVISKNDSYCNCRNYNYSYYGEKSGIHMTPDHKILTEKGWVECGKSEGLNWADVRIPDNFKADRFRKMGRSPMGCFMRMRKRHKRIPVRFNKTAISSTLLWLSAQKPSTRFNRSDIPLSYGIGTSREQCSRETPMALPMHLRKTSRCVNLGFIRQKIPNQVLWLYDEAINRRSPKNSRNVKSSSVCSLAEFEAKMFESQSSRISQLRWTRNYSLRPLDKQLREFLEGHGCVLAERFRVRSYRQQQRIQSRKLSMGKTKTKFQKQADEQDNRFSAGKNVSVRTCRKNRYRRNNIALSSRPQLANRIFVHKTRCLERMYDIRNCGSRHRFTVWDPGVKCLRIVSNCTQATARDLLAEAMWRMEQAGLDIVAHVHDEIVLEVPMNTVTVDDVCKIMNQNPAWAEDLPLASAGYGGARYYYKD